MVLGQLSLNRTLNPKSEKDYDSILGYRFWAKKECRNWGRNENDFWAI